jgi:hypothetical protein
MKPLSRLLRPLGQAARAFFTHDVALRREGETVKLVLEERSVPLSAADASARAAAQREAALLELARSQLAAVLGELPTTRRSLRHLAFLEQALAEKGFRALRKVPLEVLRRALEQFEGLVTNWSPEGLATLRSRMAVTLLERQALDSAEQASRGRETADILPDEVLPTPEVQTLDTDAENEALMAAYAALEAAAAPAAAGGPAPTGSAASVAAAAAPALERPLEFQPELPAARAGRPREPAAG